MAIPKIESYTFGEIVIDGRRYQNDVIVFPDHVQSHWWRAEGHSLMLEDLREVLESTPDVLIIGQGSVGRMDVPEEIRHQLEVRRIQVIAELTTSACDTYNHLCGQQRVVAALHLTC